MQPKYFCTMKLIETLYKTIDRINGNSPNALTISSSKALIASSSKALITRPLSITSCNILEDTKDTEHDNLVDTPDSTESISIASEKERSATTDTAIPTHHNGDDKPELKQIHIGQNKTNADHGKNPVIDTSVIDYIAEKFLSSPASLILDEEKDKIKDIIRDIIYNKIDLDDPNKEHELIANAMRCYLTDYQPLIGKIMKRYRIARCITQERLSEIVNDYFGATVCNKQLIDRAEKGNISNTKLFSFIQDKILRQNNDYELTIHVLASKLGEIIAKNDLGPNSKNFSINKLFSCRHTSQVADYLQDRINDYSKIDRDAAAQSIDLLRRMDQKIAIEPTYCPTNDKAEDSSLFFIDMYFKTNMFFRPNSAAKFVTQLADTILWERSRKPIYLQHFELLEYIDIYNENITDNASLFKQMGIDKIKDKKIEDILIEEREKIEDTINKTKQADNNLTIFNEFGKLTNDPKVRKKIMANMHKNANLAKTITNINQILCYNLLSTEEFPSLSSYGEAIEDLLNDNADKALKIFFPNELTKDPKKKEDTKIGLKKLAEYINNAPIEFMQNADALFMLFFITQNFWYITIEGNDATIRFQEQMLQEEEFFKELFYKGESIEKVSKFLLEAIKTLYLYNNLAKDPQELINNHIISTEEDITRLIRKLQWSLSNLLENPNRENIEDAIEKKSHLDNLAQFF